MASVFDVEVALYKVILYILLLFSYNQYFSHASWKILILFTMFRQQGLQTFSHKNSSGWIKEASDVTTIAPDSEDETTLYEDLIDEVEDTKMSDNVTNIFEKFLDSLYWVPGSPWSWL